MPSRSLRERWIATRNGILSNPSFQQWAAGFPLTRRTAHRRADALFDLVAGFVYSQVLVACVQLRLFDLLAQGPQPLDVLATEMALPTPAADRLLLAAAALGLVERIDHQRFALGVQGAALRGNAGLADMIAHHALLYADLADPVALLRRGGGQGRLAAFWPYAGAGDADAGAVAEYSALMAASQPMIGTDVLQAYPLKGRRCLMDVGGGEGAFIQAVAAHAPDLDLMLFDLPAVVERAKSRLRDAGLGQRVRVVGGDFLRDGLPTGADVISLVRILHDHSEVGALALLRAVHAALPSGGVVVVAEPMSRAPAADPMAEAYFGFYLLAMGRGRARQPSENRRLLAEAGFRASRVVRTRTPLLVQVVVGTA